MSLVENKQNFIFRLLYTEIGKETNSKEQREKNFKDIKEICKDIFEITKNSIIVATVRLAASETKSVFLYILTTFLFGALSMYVMSALITRLNFGPGHQTKATVLNIAIVLIAVGLIVAFESYLLTVLQQFVLPKGKP